MENAPEQAAPNSEAGTVAIPSGDDNFATAARELFDYDKMMLAKARIPRRKRVLYARAIVIGQRYKGLTPLLDLVHTDLILTYAEDGMARKEYTLPIENVLRSERLKKEKQVEYLS